MQAFKVVTTMLSTISFKEHWTHWRFSRFMLITACLVIRIYVPNVSYHDFEASCNLFLYSRNIFDIRNAIVKIVTNCIHGKPDVILLDIGKQCRPRSGPWVSNFC